MSIASTKRTREVHKFLVLKDGSPEGTVLEVAVPSDAPHELVTERLKEALLVQFPGVDEFTVYELPEPRRFGTRKTITLEPI